MKVSITAETKKFVTISEMPAVQKVVEAMKEDAFSVKEYAEMAARIASSCNTVNVLEAKAEIAGNCRVYERICDGSAQFDVWITYTAVINGGFDGIIMGGAYLSDIWDYTTDNAAEIRSHMYIRKFIEVA